MTETTHGATAVPAGCPVADTLVSNASLSDTLLPGVLAARARQTPNRVAYIFLDDSGEEIDRLDYAELHRRARAVAARLVSRCDPGERALLAFLPGLNFIVAFFGCLYARIVAVPVNPPVGAATTIPPATRSVIDASEPSIILTDSASAALCEPTLSALGTIEYLQVDMMEPGGLSEDLTTADADTLALLQFTSGSTSDPKGVLVTHRNLIANQRMIREAFGHNEDSVVVGWAPFFHDQGLIGNVLQPVYVGAPAILMSPLTFIRRPLLWLTTISRYGATTSGGPDFAYAACVAHAERTGVPDGLDLSSWTVAFNGAEPIRSTTIDRFATVFAPHGFHPGAAYPCYGLAEATLLVTASRVGRGPRIVHASVEQLQHGNFRPDPQGTELVGSGTPVPGSDVAVVDPDIRQRVRDGTVGELWVSGEHVTGGYWQNRTATAEAFGVIAGESSPRLRTGDLGFVLDGEVFVVGRVKDLIIVRGRNYYPADIENAAAAAHAAVRPGGCAAIGIPDNCGLEQVAVVVELRRGVSRDSLDDVRAAIRSSIAASAGITVRQICLVAAGQIPKTSSGKVRRTQVRNLLTQGGFEPAG